MSSIARFTVIPAAYVILRRSGKVLLSRRANTGYKDGHYSLPAGHFEGGESALMVAVREAKEEAGIIIDPADLMLGHVMHRVAEEGDHERVDFFFVTAKWQGEPYNAEPDKCDDVRWFSEEALPDDLIDEVRQAIENTRSGNTYSDKNFPA